MKKNSWIIHDHSYSKQSAKRALTPYMLERASYYFSV